jgi:uncharacterized protein (DUF1501 family)
MIERRHLLKMGAAAAAASFIPRVAFAAAATDRRLVFVIQRGAADGLNTIIPVGDPGLAAQRSMLAVDAPTKLDGLFALHPAMVETAKLYGTGQALFVPGSFAFRRAKHPRNRGHTGLCAQKRLAQPVGRDAAQG